MELLFQYPPSDKNLFKYYQGYTYNLPNIKTKALEYSIAVGGEKCFKYLITDTSIISKAFKKPHLLSKAPNVEVNKWVLNNGYKITDPFELEQSLKNAIDIGDADYLKLILEKTDTSIIKGLKDNMKQRVVYSESDVYRIKGNVKLAKILLDKGLLNNKENVLKYAIEHGQTELISFLISNGTPWLIFDYYRTVFVSDFARDYQTWKYTTDIIRNCIKDKR